MRRQPIESDLRLYCPELAPGLCRLADSEARHALSSRRLRPGDRLEVFDGKGGYARGALELGDGARPGASSRKRGDIAVRIDTVIRTSRPAHNLTLILPGCKGPRLDWLVEKTTELGVSRLFFAKFARSVVVPGPTHLERLRRRAIEACKQCCRLWLPEILQAGSVHEAVGAFPAGALAVAHLAPHSVPASRWCEKQGQKSVSVVIGPEGGLAKSELSELLDAGAQSIRLAPHILRVETAAVAAAASWAASLPATSVHMANPGESDS